MDRQELIETLRDYAGWADDNIYEVPIMLPDVLREAADTIESDTWTLNLYDGMIERAWEEREENE